jgi:hypothetical protein
MKRTGTGLVLLALALAVPAIAHEGKKHPPGDHKPAPEAPKSEKAEHGPGDHAHASPHGGLVATVDKDTHVEVLITDKELHVWFYDADMKPLALPADAKGTVVIGKEVKKLDLPIGKRPDGSADDRLVGALAVPADQKVAVVIQATVGGKARTGRVERKAAAAAASAPVTPPPAPAAPKGTP